MKRKIDAIVDELPQLKRLKLDPVLLSQKESSKRAIITCAFEAFKDELPKILEQARVDTLNASTGLVKLLENADKHKHFKLFECAIAYKYDLFLWENLPCETLEGKNALRYKGAFPDFGIDCATATLDVSVQAKWFAKKSTVSFRSASTFFAYSTILESSKKMIASSQDTRICDTAARLPGLTHEILSDQEFAAIIIECCQDTVMRQNKKDIEMQPINAIPIPILPVIKKVHQLPLKVNMQEMLARKPLILRDYQELGIAKLSEAIEHSESKVIKCHMACGTGKTLIGVLLAEKHKETADFPWAWLAPSIQLLEQAAKAFRKYAPHIRFCMVGGGHVLDDKQDYDCILSTYQSVSHITDMEFDVVVVDEGHHVENYLQDIDEDEEEEAESESDSEKKQGHLQQIAQLTCRKFLLLSATLNEDSEDANFSYDIQQAIQEGNLCDYEICIPVLENENGDRQPEMAKLMLENAHIWTAPLVYCNSLSEAKRFTEHLQKLGMNAEYMDGTMDMKQREVIMSRFENGKTRDLTSVYVLGEGIDLPWANTCIFLDSRDSEINVIQCVGRVLRLHPGKTLAHIVLPSYSESKQLGRFLRIMNSHDDRIGKACNSKKSGRVNIVLPGHGAGISQDANENEILYMNVFSSLGDMVQRGDWMQKYHNACEIAIRIKKMPSMIAKDVYEKAAGIWLSNQRHRYSQGKLPDQRKKLLEIVPFWTAPIVREKIQGSRNDIWMKRYHTAYGIAERLKRLPSTVAKNIEEKSAGIWIASQRSKYLAGKLSEDRNTLMHVFPYWSWPEAAEGNSTEIWMRKYREALEISSIIQKRPSTIARNVPERVAGMWLANQRRTYMKCDADRKKLLDNLPFWIAPIAKERKHDISNAEAWMLSYRNAYEIAAKIKKMPSKCVQNTQEKKAGYWLSRQRCEYINGKLCQDRRTLLDAFPHWIPPVARTA